MEEAFQLIQKYGKVIKTFSTEIFDQNGTKCAVCENEVYIRDLNFDFSTLKSIDEKLNKTDLKYR